MEITRISTLTGIERTKEFDITEEQWNDYLNGTLIQIVAKNKISSCEVLAQQLVAAVKYVLNVHGVEYFGIIINIKPKGKDVKADMTYVEEFSIANK